MFSRKYLLSDIDVVAMANSFRVIDLERTLGFFWEPRWQEWVIATGHWLIIFFNWAYIFTFLPVAALTAIIVYRTDYGHVRLLPQHHPDQLCRCPADVRPLSPRAAEDDNRLLRRQHPRLRAAGLQQPGLPGVLQRLCGLCPACTSPGPSCSASSTTERASRCCEWRGWCIPTLTFFAITVTANHYIVDAIAGGVLILASFLTYEAFRRYRVPGAPAGPAGRPPPPLGGRPPSGPRARRQDGVPATGRGA